MSVPRPAPPPGPYLVAGARRAGLAAARAIAAVAGSDQVRVWDAADDDATRLAREELAALGVATDLGGDGVALLEGPHAPGCVVKSPGIPFDRPLPAAAIARGIPVIDELELAWRLDDRPTYAITGTNGKSTVAELVRAILAAAGRRPVIAGNTLTGLPLSAVVPGAGDTIVCETSSFQLAGTDAFLADAAVVTNLTPEHLWHHGTMERYAACKRRAILQGDAVVPLAVIGVDDEFGTGLAADAARRGARVARVGPEGDYAIERAELTWSGMRVTARTPSGPAEVTITSPGMHMAANALSALALADLLGIDRATTIPALAATAPVPGRFERVDGGGPVAVVVDFAHNPGGITCALATARALAGRGRVLALCSAAWTSDTAALSDMGRAAAGGADVVVISTDRWRPSDPLDAPPAIAAGARAEGCRDVRSEPDRGEAIASLIDDARPGDVVMILGRGARTVALDADGARVAFDDRDVARAALAARA